MIDFVQSPVPFITGISAKSKAAASKIQNDQRVIEAMENGLSVINLITGTVLVTQESGIRGMLHKGPDETSWVVLACFAQIFQIKSS